MSVKASLIALFRLIVRWDCLTLVALLCQQGWLHYNEGFPNNRRAHWWWWQGGWPDHNNVDSQQRGIIRFQRRSPSLSVEPSSCPAFSSVCVCVYSILFNTHRPLCVCATFQDPQYFSTLFRSFNIAGLPISRFSPLKSNSPFYLSEWNACVNGRLRDCQISLAH